MAENSKIEWTTHTAAESSRSAESASMSRAGF